MNNVYLVNYRHVNSDPFKSITELPVDDACKLADRLFQSSPCRAHNRFGPNFITYYRDRKRVEQWMYERFLDLGGVPERKSPIYFTLCSSEQLADNFENSVQTRLELDDISENAISFTLGDSMELYYRGELQRLFTKSALLSVLDGDMDSATRVMVDKSYIEAQLWSAKYFPK